MKFTMMLTTGLFIASAAFAEGNQVPMAPVYSRGKVKVTVAKSKLVNVGDSYDTVVENVCTKEIDINVWDIRDPQGYWQTSQVYCETELEHKEVLAVVPVQAVVGMYAPHNGTVKIPMFSFMGGISIAQKDRQQSAKAPSFDTTLFSFATMSKDINTKSLMNVVGPAQMVVCNDENGSQSTTNQPRPAPVGTNSQKNQPKGCTVTNPEVVNATIEFIGE